VKKLKNSFIKKFKVESFFHSFTCSLFHSEQRGSNLLETLLAIGLVAAMAPFVYARVAEVSREITDINAARQMHAWRPHISGFIRENQAVWEDSFVAELSRNEIAQISPLATRTPALAFIEKFNTNAGPVVEAYLVFSEGYETMRSLRIARALGVDAAVADDNHIAFSGLGGWSVQSELLRPGDIIYRIHVNFLPDDSYAFLHRTPATEEHLNTMERDLLMMRNNIMDATTITARLLDSRTINTWFVASDLLSTMDAIFPVGANMDATNVSVANVRVTGDTFGFRNISAAEFRGGGVGNWSNAGAIVADRVSVSESVNVGRNLTVNSPSSRTVSGIDLLRAYSLNTAFISTEQLIFADGFGLLVSNELSAGWTMGPLRIGSWDFPNVIAPRFRELELSRTGVFQITPPAGFEDIMGSRWRDLGH